MNISKFNKLLKSQTATQIRLKHLTGDIKLSWNQYLKIKELSEVERNEKE